MSEVILQLAREQEKIRAIDSLSNCIDKLNAKDAKEVAYLIHRICDSFEGITSNLARDIAYWKLYANKDIFISV
jgi:hypothetical protein